MKRTLILTAMLAAVAVVALGVPDPWRIKVSDQDPNAPIDTGWGGEAVRESFGSGGGTYRQYYWNAETAVNDKTKEGYYSLNSYNASTGAISFGTLVQTTIPGEATWLVGMKNIIKVGSIYKTWKWSTGYTGQYEWYATSADGATFSVPTLCTIYGSTSQATCGYGYSSMIRSTAGVYVGEHNCSNYGAKGVMTSGVGETEWWDIDTGTEGGGYGYEGDPIDQDGIDDSVRQDSHAATACNGTRLSLESGFPPADYAWTGFGLGMIISTAGFENGGDEYIWIADTDSNNTRGIGDSLLTGIGLNGLSGPSLRCRGPGAWMGWQGNALGLVNGDQSTATAKYVLLYCAAWDTNSDGTEDMDGMGRARLWLTRNNADLNMDGTVNFSDIAPFSTAYGSTSGVSSNYNGDADFNKDGKVDFKDISPLSTRYGSNCSYGSP